MPKKYLKINVYEAAQQRLEKIFSDFENVLVAFSGGKDSGVLLNLAYDYAKKTDNLNKLAMYTIDYEAAIEETNKYIERAYNESFDGIKKFWCCLPIAAQCAVSMYQDHWIPWDNKCRDIWVRNLPDSQHLITKDNCPIPKAKGMDDYHFQDKFCKWFGSQYGKTAVLVGVRCDESLNRLAIITGNRVNTHDDLKSSKVVDDNTVVFYPLYDWTTSDIWVANYRFNYDYNKAYDLMYMAGVSVYQMRVASPFNDYAQNSLKLYKVLSPNTWSKMVGRVNGVNFTNIYGGTTAMGWKTITKPKHFTWKEYAEFLLSTLPEDTRNKYLQKLKKSQEVWKNKGGARSPEFIDQLEQEGWKIRRPGIKGNKNNKQVLDDREVVYIDEMADDTNVKEFKDAPSWKRLCVCIMKNDTKCLYMGFARTKKDMEKRRKAMEKYKNL